MARRLQQPSVAIITVAAALLLLKCINRPKEPIYYSHGLLNSRYTGPRNPVSTLPIKIIINTLHSLTRVYIALNRRSLVNST